MDDAFADYNACPVVLVHHVDPHRYSVEVAEEKVRHSEWDYGGAHAFYATVKPIASPPRCAATPMCEKSRAGTAQRTTGRRAACHF